MSKLKQLSGEDVVHILKSFGFQVQSQKGSHVKLRRLIDGKKETLIIPNHSRLDTGNLSGDLSTGISIYCKRRALSVLLC